MLAVLSAVTLYFVIHHFERDLPDVSDLRANYRPPQVTRVLARDGTLLAELFVERRTVVPIESLPNHVKLAVLAAEDARFYEHEGLNYFGIARAMLRNLKAGRTVQGGSTITQQVVKNVLLDSERTYRRKIREALLSRKLEQSLTKDQILELYLNHIYFGHGRYGIEEAARDYFGKSARELSIAQAALMAGIVAGPESFSPRRDLKKALVRQDYVLRQMRAQRFLSDEQYEQAKNEVIELSPGQDVKSELAPEAVEIARKLLATLEPERAKFGGFTITTSIDPRMQASARKAIREALSAYDKRHGLSSALKIPKAAQTKKAAKGRTAPAKDVVYQGTPDYSQHRVYVGTVLSSDDNAGTFNVQVGTAIGTVRLTDFERYNPQKLAPSAFAPVGAQLRVSLLAPVPQSADKVSTEVRVPLRLELGPQGALVALDTRTRHVIAIVGSYELSAGGLDRAMQSKRQPGSTFKPVVYSYALHIRRVTPASRIDVTPDVFEGNYRPLNYEGWQGKDAVSLRDAIANSINLVAVRVLRDVGPRNVVPWAQALGIQSHLGADLSLALGSYEVTPLELCGAYATFAGGGTYIAPQVVTRIVGPDGKEVTLPTPTPSRRVMDEAEAYVTTHLLASVVDYGTGARARALGRPVAGKTGTSNESKDTWFAGYTSEIAAVAWIGYDDNKPLGASETGGGTALPAWVMFMKGAHEGRPKSEFARPSSGITVIKIDKRTGFLPYPDDADVYDEVFLSGTEPVEVATPPESDAGAAMDAMSSSNVSDASVSPRDAGVDP